MTIAGLPAAITFSGMSEATTLPAPITLFFPIVTPLQIVAPSPTQTFSSQYHGTGHTDDLCSVVNVMPVCIGDVGAGRKHAVVADGNVAGGVKPAAWADQDIVAQGDVALVITEGPGRERYSFCGRRSPYERCCQR